MRKKTKTQRKKIWKEKEHGKQTIYTHIYEKKEENEKKKNIYNALF